MTGTQFPQEETVDGDTVTLQSMYLDGGVLLVVDEDDTNITPLTDKDDCITNAQLESIETGNRQSQVGPAMFECGFWIFTSTCTRYHVYGIVADHYATYSDGTCKTSTVGRIYTTDDRRSFAIYYEHSIPPSNNAQYLVVTAQEIGHDFNLHHEDSNGSTTIMTGIIDNTYEFTFSGTSKTHLKDHPADCKFPGTGSFYSVSSDHSLHSYVSATCN